MDQLRRKCPQIFVVFIVSIILLFYFVEVILLWIILQPKSNFETVIYLIFYHLFLFMLLWSLITTIFSDPGKVPIYWGFYLNEYEYQRRKYCLTCHVFKPQRCHHCSACNKCVLNMDHHWYFGLTSPWINNCIGFYNRKFFMLMLIYTLITIALEIIGILACIQSIIELFRNGIGKIFMGILILSVLMLASTLLILLSTFFYMHIKLILENSTTLENLDNQRFNRPEEESKYDIGSYYNWIQVFGRTVWYWPLPLFVQGEGPVGDGIVWPQN